MQGVLDPQITVYRLLFFEQFGGGCTPLLTSPQRPQLRRNGVANVCHSPICWSRWPHFVPSWPHLVASGLFGVFCLIFDRFGVPTEPTWDQFGIPRRPETKCIKNCISFCVAFWIDCLLICLLIFGPEIQQKSTESDRGSNKNTQNSITNLSRN